MSRALCGKGFLSVSLFHATRSLLQSKKCTEDVGSEFVWLKTKYNKIRVRFFSAFVCVLAGRPCSPPAPIAIIDHSTGPASGCVKKPAFLSAISQSYLPLTELPLSTLAQPAPSSPVDTEK